MNPSDPQTFEQHRKRSEELECAYFEQRISEDEAAELLELWRRHPEFRENAGDRYEMEHALSFLARLEKRPPSFRLRNARVLRLHGVRPVFDKPLPIDTVFSSEIAQIASLKIPETVSDDRYEEKTQDSVSAQKVRSALRVESRMPSTLKWIAPLLAVLFLFGIYSEFRPRPDEAGPAFVEPVFSAEVVSAIDVEVAPDDKPIKQGLRLETDRLRFESGTVELAISNGVRLVLEGPVDFKLNSPMQTICTTGRLSAFVPPEGKGFEIATPHLTIRDLGTEFFVNVTEKESELHVVRGEVLTNWFNADWISFNSGQAIRIDAASLKPTRFIAETERFVTESEMTRRLTDFFIRRQVVQENEELRRQADRNRIFSLGKNSLRFQSVRDHAEMSFPGKHENLSLVAEVRLDGMKHYGALLCVGNGFPDRPGEFVWQFERSGELLFHIRDGRNVRYFNSPAVVTPGDWKTRLHLAVVADETNREVRHYVDGRKVAALPWSEPIALQMESGSLGNDPPRKRKKTVRYWNGEFFEMDVYSRALSDAEIVKMYENAR